MNSPGMPTETLLNGRENHNGEREREPTYRDCRQVKLV